ncbi:MAG: 5-carboxymethyl-2-hydroxymuconate isomerase, partial [Alphaproteobacteria bacterium]|nr:5-carboxymethyl-2-hydroxymuconate isomerase [Alphaproteobacteria bacterium]
MPHLRIEYSANLEPQIDMGEFCQVLHQVVMTTGLFERGALRLRAFKSEHYAVADLLPQNAFIDMEFRVGQGRSDDALKSAGNAIFDAATAYLQALFAAPHFALS